MDMKRPRKLNFNAPLLSIRRPSVYTNVEMYRTNSIGASWDTSDGVPFSWEQAPGKPKDMERSDIHDEDPPQPKLPPGRWHPPKEATDEDDGDQLCDHDDGCDGDVDDDDDDDDDDNYDDDDVFSDAIDIFSLSESIDAVETVVKVHGLASEKLERAEYVGSQSPNFIIQRFLPDALAASSALTLSKNLNKKLSHSNNYPEDYASRAVGRSYSSPKGCGLEIFFPWRMKHKLCGIKSPVRQGTLNVKA